MDMTELSRAGSLPDRHSTGFQPSPPESLKDTGLPPAWLNQLVLRHFYTAGELDLPGLTARLHLPTALAETLVAKFRMARLIAPAGGNPSPAGWVFTLTASGRLHADEAFNRCRYIGPAPVSLDGYRRSLSATDSASPLRRDELSDALRGIALDDPTLEQLGIALASQRSFVVHGPPGSGRSSLVGRLAAVVRGTVWVPHAVLAGDQVICIYDSDLHQPVAGNLLNDWRAVGTSQATSTTDGALDRRWVACQKPVVVLDGAMGEAALEPQVLDHGHAIAAPAQIKASPGLLVIDNADTAGRVSHKLLQRLHKVAERGADRLIGLRGQVLDLPTRLRLVTVESQAPARRGFQWRSSRHHPTVSITPLSVGAYRRAVELAAHKHGLRCEAGAVDRLLEHHQRRGRMPRLGAVPDALFGRIADRIRWRGDPPSIDADQIDWAWQQAFGRAPEGGVR